MNRRNAIALLVALLVSAFPSCTARVLAQDAASIPTDRVIQPTELVKLLQANSAVKPVVLQVGSRVLFAQAHIVGSQYAGPGAKEEGLRTLRAQVEQLPHNRLIVIYCGCCPWTKCPNMGPAYRALIAMGFTQVSALYLEDNFGTDWVSHGYPTDKGE